MAPKTYNWAVLGPGKIAHSFSDDLKLLPNAKLYAVGSRDIERAKEFAQTHGYEKAYGSYKELVEDPEIDIVYISSPHVCHYEHSLLCMEHGKSVLCEKPVSINATQFRNMIDEARKNKVFFMEALWTRFIPSFVKCKELIEEGILGEISLIEADFCFHAPYNAESRLFNPMLGGGSLLDIGIYPVFIAVNILGKPTEVEAIASLTPSKVDIACSMLLRHENGAISVLLSSLLTKGRGEAFIHGNKGKIRIKSRWHSQSSIDLLLWNNENPVNYSFPEKGKGYQHEAAEVMKCISEGKMESSLLSWKNSLDLMTTLDAIRLKAGIVFPKVTETL